MFDFFKRNNNEKNLKPSSDIITSLGLSTTQPSKEVIKSTKDKNKLANKIIDLCKNIESPIAYYNIAYAYRMKGSEYRVKVIEYLNKFLSNPKFDKLSEHFSIQQFYNISTFNLKLAGAYIFLGETYEEEYEFEKALNCYMKSYNIDPYESPIYCCIANIYRKMNNLDKAIEFLKNAKESKYYKVYEWKNPIVNKTYKDDTFIKVIDNYLNDLKNKKEKDYIYRPRKKKI